MGRGAFLAGGLLAAMLPLMPAEARVLLEGDDATVRVAMPWQCPDPPRVIVTAERPELYGGDSVALQRLVDGAYAMLAFECPELAALQVEGRLRGLEGPVYRAQASSADRWRLVAAETLRAEVLAGAPRAAPEAAAGDKASAGARHEVAGLTAGMTVPEAAEAAEASFGVAPEYDRRAGVMTLQADGCPADYDWARMASPPAAGWKCLEARFTDERVERLYRLELVQVVATRDLGAVERLLTERFGTPTDRAVVRPRETAWGRGEARSWLAWGEAVASRPERAPGDLPGQVHALEATLESFGDVVVTTLVLYRPGIRPGGDRGAEPAPPLDLRL